MARAVWTKQSGPWPRIAASCTAVNILKENDYSDFVSFEWEKLWFPEVEEPDVAFPQFLDAVSAML